MTEPLRERLVLAAAGGAQGLSIWLLIEAWPATHAARAGAVALLTFLGATAAVLHFAWTGTERGRLVALSIGTGALYAAVAGFVGWGLPLEPTPGLGDENRAATWLAAFLITLYVLGPFLQIYQRRGRLHFPYQELFLDAWNNFFVALVGGLFVGALWVVLILWAALFNLVGISFFADLFAQEIFISVATGAAAGFGIALGRESQRVVATLRGVSLAVFRGLLPLVSAVALLFLFTLPFTGLSGLWDTDHASQILLTWVGLIVLFLNAVYQDGSDAAPLAPPWARLVEGALLATTAFMAIAVYGVSLRIEQYGLTPNRVWGVLVTLVLGTYALGYALAVVRRGSPWLRGVRAVNLLAALLIVALGLLAHTPLLDPIAWSAASQYARLAEGRVSADAFDYGTLHFKLGRLGRERIDTLETLSSHPEIAAIRERIEVVRAAESYWQWQQRHGPGFGPELFDVYPPGSEMPAGLLEVARSSQQFWVQGACEVAGSCAAFPVDLDGLPPTEWVVVVTRPGWTTLHAFAADELAGFTAIGQLQSEGHRVPEPEELRETLDRSDYQTIEPAYRDLLLDDTRYRLVPPR